MHLSRRVPLFALAILFAAVRHASAGTVSLAWDPVSATDLAGYRVYYGTAPGTYTSSVDVGNVTQTTISGLTDCTTYYFGVKAYDTSGNQSTSYSNEITGWTRPTVTSASPSSAEQGRTLSVTLSGTSFPSGAAVAFANTGITVNSVTVNGCGQVTASITISNSAATGAGNADITDPDGVFGTGTGIFTVVAAVPPTVQSTNPTDGASGIAATVKPTVTFSEAMLASSITAANVKLLDSTGAAVGQAAGSPALSADGKTATITTAASLASGKTYTIQVVGGTSGVLDLANHGMSATFTQTTGFSTVGDTTPPSISAVTAGGITATSATITWTTNEVADSQVFYRRQGDAAYQQTAINASLVTAHSVLVQGLPPSTTIEYYVRSADGSGNAATSTPTQTFLTSSTTHSYIRFEAEAGALTAPVRNVGSASGAFTSAYLDTPSGTAPGTASSPAGTAVLGVNIPSAGSWTLWVRMYALSSTQGAWFESIDAAARQPIEPAAAGAWQWVAGRTYTLTAGLHSLELGGDEPQARVDRVIVTDDPAFVPTEQPVGDQTAPAADTALTGTPGDTQATLTWVNSSSGDYAQTVIRFRTDGAYPVSPVDGFGALARTGSPGLSDNFTHTGLTDGTTYSYSVFAIDAYGNVSVSATVQVTPVAKVPPGQVKNAHRTDKH